MIEPDLYAITSTFAVMDYATLSIIGGILLLITAIFDYYWTRIQSSTNVSFNESPSSPKEIPVGSRPSSEQKSYLKTVRPRYIGYLLAVLLQIPVLLSELGWLV